MIDDIILSLAKRITGDFIPKRSKRSVTGTLGWRLLDPDVMSE